MEISQPIYKASQLPGFYMIQAFTGRYLLVKTIAIVELNILG